MSSAEETYYCPEPSHWPIVAVAGIFGFTFGTALTVNGAVIGPYTMAAGVLILAYLFYGWFSDVIGEIGKGYYSKKVDISFRQGMLWFIASEVAFFATFFGCLWYYRNVASDWQNGVGYLGSTFKYLYAHLYEAKEILSGAQEALSWTANNGHVNKGGDFTNMGGLGVPLINTILLLSSGVTITIAHHALLSGHRKTLINALGATIVLGLVFVCFQAYEYGHAYASLNLTLESGIYGSTFYLLTGFHGFHVTVGAIMLLVVWARCAKGHFSKDQHFAFEAVAWYWHFVDVVWVPKYPLT